MKLSLEYIRIKNLSHGHGLVLHCSYREPDTLAVVQDDGPILLAYSAACSDLASSLYSITVTPVTVMLSLNYQP